VSVPVDKLRLPVVPFGRVGAPEEHPRWDGEKIRSYDDAPPTERNPEEAVTRG